MTPRNLSPSDHCEIEMKKTYLQAGMWATHLYPNGSQIKNEDHISLNIYI